MNRMKTRLRAVLFFATLAAACDDHTGTLGILTPEGQIGHSHTVVDVYTRSIGMGAVRTAGDVNYLGDIIDPETDTRIRSEFAAQFYAFENFTMHPLERLFPSTAAPENRSVDHVKCDSVELRLYFEKYYGDGDNPMKLEVYPMSTTRIMSEDSAYYSDTDLSRYVDPTAEPIATKVFSPRDYILPEAERNSSKHSQNIRIVLPREWGTRVMQAYYRHPEHFKDSYSFIRNVCPGFFFRLKSGSGNMLAVSVGTINLSYSYYNTARPDSARQETARFASTPEVIQSTHFSGDDMEELIWDERCTYLKTPAGICTEVTLPIDDIMRGHETDSVSKAQLVIPCYDKKDDAYTLGTPKDVLLVREAEMHSFFEKKMVSNSMTSFTTTLSTDYNTYTFDNLARLISYIHAERNKGIKDTGLTAAEWEARNPMWNKCVIIPVKRAVTADSNQQQIETSVTHDMDMNSVRLAGGPHTPLQMQVIYSRFK